MKNRMVFMRLKWYWTKVHNHPTTLEHSDTTSWLMQAWGSVSLVVTWRGCLLSVAPKIDLASRNFLWFWVHYHHTMSNSKDLTSVIVTKIIGLKEGGHTMTEMWQRLTTPEETSLWPSVKDLKMCCKHFEKDGRGHCFNHSKEGEGTKCWGLPRGVCTNSVTSH